MMRCNLIFEAARVLLTTYTLNVVLTTRNIGFYFNRFQCKQAESVTLSILSQSIGRKCYIRILTVMYRINFVTNLPVHTLRAEEL